MYGGGLLFIPDLAVEEVSHVFRAAFYFDESNFDESKSPRFEIRNKKQFQNILKSGIKSNLDHVMRENDYENNEF